MAKGIKTGGKDFVKGKPGGPGRPPLPDDVKELRQLTRADLDRHLTRLMTLDPHELAKEKTNPKITMLELLIISVMTHGVNKGDQARLGWLVERISSIGKVKEHLDIEVTRRFKDLTNEELLKLLPEAMKALEDGRKDS